MKSDIFVDNCAAATLSNPMGGNMQPFFLWLLKKGWLVVSQKLLAEYFRTCQSASGKINIATLVAHLIAEGRLVKVSNKELKSVYFTKSYTKHLRSNNADWVHIKTVILSTRRIAYTLDVNLITDMTNYPGINILVSNDITSLPYDS